MLGLDLSSSASIVNFVRKLLLVLQSLSAGFRKTAKLDTSLNNNCQQMAFLTLVLFLFICTLCCAHNCFVVICLFLCLFFLSFYLKIKLTIEFRFAGPYSGGVKREQGCNESVDSDRWRDMSNWSPRGGKEKAAGTRATRTRDTSHSI